jgi:hypothetical protein
MSTLDTEDPATEPQQLRLLWWAVGGSLSLLSLAGGLLWWSFGPVIFVDLLTLMQSCF